MDYYYTKQDFYVLHQLQQMTDKIIDELQAKHPPLGPPIPFAVILL